MPSVISCPRIVDCKMFFIPMVVMLDHFSVLGFTARCKYWVRYRLDRSVRLSPVTCALYAETLRVITTYIQVRVSKQMFITGYRPRVTLHIILLLIRKNSKVQSGTSFCTWVCGYVTTQSFCSTKYIVKLICIKQAKYLLHSQFIRSTEGCTLFLTQNSELHNIIQ